MTQKAEGMSYAPQGKPAPACQKGDFIFAVHSLDHGHIYGMCNGLLEAGGDLKLVYDPDPEKLAQFKRYYPEVRIAQTEAEILEDAEIQLVAGAAIPYLQGPLGMRVILAGRITSRIRPRLPRWNNLKQRAA
jgi:hypothetical protein